MAPFVWLAILCATEKRNKLMCVCVLISVVNVLLINDLVNRIKLQTLKSHEVTSFRRESENKFMPTQLFCIEKYINEMRPSINYARR